MAESQELLKRELLKCPDYQYEIDRGKIRFGGYGPQIQKEPLKIWPRDVVDCEDEIRKILSDELKSLIENEAQCDRIRDVIRRVFDGLKKCNVTSLLDRYCTLPPGCFDRVPLKIHHALDAYTTYNQVITFIHQTLRTINVNRTKLPRVEGKTKPRFKRKNNPIEPREDDLVYTLFGCRRNYEIYKRHIAIIVRAGVGVRQINLGHLVSFEDTTMDLTHVKWLSGVNPKAHPRVFLQVIYAVTRFVLELLRRYFYITISNPYRDQLFYYRYDLWQKLYSMAIQELIDQRVLEIIDSRNIIRPSGSSIPLPTSKLKFYLKKDGLRAICTAFKPVKRSDESTMKAILKFVLIKMPNYRKFNLDNLMLGLKHIRRRVLDENKNIYFVKVDIKDCFQSINQEKLRKIILDVLVQSTNDSKIKISKLTCHTKERRKTDGRLKPGRRFGLQTLDPESIRSSRKFLLVEEFDQPMIMSVNEFDLKHLSPNVIYPILKESREGKRNYRLLTGIRQGSSFSPLLCAIYLSAAFNKYLSEYLNSDDCRLFRHVDDILFLSTDLEMARKFMRKMLEGFKDFNLKVNLEKSVCNFEWSAKHKDICRLDTDDIVFFKQYISMKTLKCSYCFSHNWLGLQYTFKASPYSSQTAVREHILKLKVDLIHLDHELNPLDQLIDNIFEKCTLFAHRAATMIIVSMQLSKLTRPNPAPCQSAGSSELREPREVTNEDPSFVRSLMSIIARRIHSTIKVAVKRQLIVNDLTFAQIRLITCSAFLCTWTRKRMRHRMIERSALQRTRDRYLMRYRIFDETTGFAWADRVLHLERTFNTRPIAKHVLLPDKIH